MSKQVRQLMEQVKNLQKLIKETTPVSDNEEIQMYVDIIDGMDKKNPTRAKYIQVLKDKYQWDYTEPSDEEYVNNPSLEDIKTLNDFGDFNNYVKYCKKICLLRHKGTDGGWDIKLENPKHDIAVPVEKLIEVGKILDFEVEVGESEYNYASVQTFSKTVRIPDNFPLQVGIHEMGHVYDNEFYKDGIAKDMTRSITMYGTLNPMETFAENFASYFCCPNLLKEKLPEVYQDLDQRINTQWKTAIYNLMG